MRRGYRQVLVLAVLAAVIAAVPAARAIGGSVSVALVPGDIVVVDRDCCAGGGVFRVDPVTGEQTLLSEGGFLTKPWGIGMDPYGRILVADADCCGGEIDSFGGGQGGVIRVDPATGEQVVLSSQGSFKNPRAVVVDAAGEILVADSRCCGSRYGGIIRVDPDTGAQHVVSTAASFDDPYGVDVEASGMIVSADTDCCVEPDLGGVIRVDPATGAQSIVSGGGNFVEPIELAVDQAGALWVADTLCCGRHGGVIRVDPVSGAQEVVSSLGKFKRPTGIDVEESGDVLVADSQCCGDGHGGIVRVDPATGAQTVVSSGGLFKSPMSVDIVVAVQPLPSPSPSPSASPSPSPIASPSPSPSPIGSPTITDFKVRLSGAASDGDAGVGGSLTCGAGYPWEVTAQVTQSSSGASGQGIVSGSCAGAAGIWDVLATHGSGPAFVPGTVRVCATATVLSGGQPADTESLCRSVSLK